MYSMHASKGCNGPGRVGPICLLLGLGCAYWALTGQRAKSSLGLSQKNEPQTLSMDFHGSRPTGQVRPESTNFK